MLRFVFNTIAVVLIGLGAGYFFWGSRVGNLTQALNNMVLEEDALRARLAGAPGVRPAKTESGAETDGEPAMGDDSPASVLVALDALKAEVQFQAKLIDQQSRLLQQIAAGETGSMGPGMAACRESTQNLTAQLQRCMVENGDLRTRLGSTGTRPVWPSPEAERPPTERPRY